MYWNPIRVPSRTVPLVSKVCNISMVPLATQIITSEFSGAPSPLDGMKEKEIPYYGVKEAVFRSICSRKLTRC